MQSFCALLGLVALLSALAAPAADINKGKEVYRDHCANCHGDTGRPEFPDAPNLRRGEGLSKSDVELARDLKNGIMGMPAYRGVLTEQEILDVVAYTRSLRR